MDYLERDIKNNFKNLLKRRYGKRSKGGTTRISIVPPRVEQNMFGKTWWGGEGRDFRNIDRSSNF